MLIDQVRQRLALPPSARFLVIPAPRLLECTAMQLKLGPWAMGSTGETPNLGVYDCAYLRRHNFTQLFDEVCDGKADWGPFVTARGRCVRYRQEQESCRPFLGGSRPGDKRRSALDPQYPVDPVTGRPPRRPMLCAPGLVCTGDTEPVPYTCVKERPPDVCYQVLAWRCPWPSLSSKTLGCNCAS